MAEPENSKKELAQLGLHAILKMVFEDNFIHAGIYDIYVNNSVYICGLLLYINACIAYHVYIRHITIDMNIYI